MSPSPSPSSLDRAHVVMLAQYLPLHFLSTMQHLSRRVGKLTMLLSEPMDASRDWAPDFTGLEVKVQKSIVIPIKHRHPLGFEDRGTLIVPYSTVGDLAKLKPDVVISVEVGARTLQAALVHKLRARFKLIVQVRESENTARSRGVMRRSLRRLLLPRVDGVFVNGQSGRKHVLACGVDAGRISIVPSGTDTAVFGKHVRKPRSGADLRLLYVGQLIPRKGVVPFAHTLAEVAREMKRTITWSIAGKGPQEAELRAIAWPENVRLDFMGSKPYRELPQRFAEADAFVMPSLSDEWGMVVNEAMASGLPILGCTGVQAVEELVRDGEEGWTYGPENRDGLRAGLRALLAAPQEQLAALGARAHRKAMEISDEYTAAAMVAGVEKAFAR